HRRHGGRHRLSASSGQPGQDVPLRDEVPRLPEHEGEQSQEAREVSGDDAAADLRAAAYCRSGPPVPGAHAASEVACAASLDASIPQLTEEPIQMIPRYLVDAAPSELPVVERDVIVIGAGIAGLFTAIKASERHSVLIITKKSLLDSNTRYAQGGIAAVISEDDSPALHRQDTLIA